MIDYESIYIVFIYILFFYLAIAVLISIGLFIALVATNNELDKEREKHISAGR